MGMLDEDLNINDKKDSKSDIKREVSQERDLINIGELIDNAIPNVFSKSLKDGKLLNDTIKDMFNDRTVSYMILAYKFFHGEEVSAKINDEVNPYTTNPEELRTLINKGTIISPREYKDLKFTINKEYFNKTLIPNIEKEIEHNFINDKTTYKETLNNLIQAKAINRDYFKIVEVYLRKYAEIENSIKLWNMLEKFEDFDSLNSKLLQIIENK